MLKPLARLYCVKTWKVMNNSQTNKEWRHIVLIQQLHYKISLLVNYLTLYHLLKYPGSDTFIYETQNIVKIF